MSIVESDPVGAARNAVERVRKILEATSGVAETDEARLLLDAVCEQVGEELDVLSDALSRVSPRCSA